MSSLQTSRLRKWLLNSPPGEWAIFQLRQLLIGALRQGSIPQHVAFVMDGNRRFARSHHMETIEGHNLGFEALARILEVCYKSGVRVVTIYAFSIENFKRSRSEVDALMALAKLKLTQLAQHGALLDRYGAAIRVLGQRALVPPDVLAAIDRAVEQTQGNSNALLNVCFPYTARDEMTSAIRDVVEDYTRPVLNAGRSEPRAFSEEHIVRQIRSRHLRAPSPDSATASDTDDSALSSTTTLHGSTTPEAWVRGDEVEKRERFPDPETIDAATLSGSMFTGGMPPLDLLVRTSGVQRLSDFMLWQVHQDTQIAFLDCMWPEFDLWTFLPVLVQWQWRQKRNGTVLKLEEATNLKEGRKEKSRGQARKSKRGL